LVLLSQIGIMNPFSRIQESEADYLGMIFASLSGYDIRETKKIVGKDERGQQRKRASSIYEYTPLFNKKIKDLSEWESSVILDYPPITVS